MPHRSAQGRLQDLTHGQLAGRTGPTALTLHLVPKRPLAIAGLGARPSWHSSQAWSSKMLRPASSTEGASLQDLGAKMDMQQANAAAGAQRYSAPTQTNQPTNTTKNA